MLLISNSLLWSFFYFFNLFYVLILFSCILYIIPTFKEFFNFSRFKRASTFEFITGYDFFWILAPYFFLLFVINSSWSSNSLLIWFGNLCFSAFQYKFFFLILFCFFLIFLSYSTVFYYTSKDNYDYLITFIHFFLWLFLIFFSNNLFTVVFFIEILSTLVFLLIVSSTFSTTYFYNNLNLNLSNYFSNTMPFFFIQTLIFFFWISLLASLNLFFSITLIYLNFYTLDWYFLEATFLFFLNFSTLNDYYTAVVLWFNFIFSLFLKSGMAPFYFWKPAFFKGLSFHSLYFYIFIFYFFIFLFFIQLLIVNLNDLFFFFVNINIFIITIGFIFLLFFLCEAYYLKAFFALSSILNSLFVFLAMSGSNMSDLFFLI